MTSWMRRRLSDDWFKFFFWLWLLMSHCTLLGFRSLESPPSRRWHFWVDDFPFPSQRFGWEMFSRTLEATNLSGFADLFGIYNVKLIGSPQSPQKSFLIARLVRFGEAVGVLRGLWVLFSFCEWLIFLFGGLQEALQEFWVFFWGWHYWNIWAQCVINLFLAEISWTLRSVEGVDGRQFNTTSPDIVEEALLENPKTEYARTTQGYFSSCQAESMVQMWRCS